MRKSAICITTILLALTASAQTAPPVFEVVSIKAYMPGQQRQDFSFQYLPGGRFSARGVPIPLLVAEAYGTARLNPSEEFRKLDVSRIERDVYDIEAIAPMDSLPPGTSGKARNDKIREMLKTLLADRFKLRVHYETKEQPVYAIVVAKGGHKLSSAEECPDKPTSFFDPGSCHSMEDLTIFAQRTARLELPVIDKTGLTGLYSFPPVDWSSIMPGRNEGNDPNRPTFDDLLGKLGLKLERQKALVDMLFVDHVEPPTTEN